MPQMHNHKVHKVATYSVRIQKPVVTYNPGKSSVTNKIAKLYKNKFLILFLYIYKGTFK
jgi:hypothetical protein